MSSVGQVGGPRCGPYQGSRGSPGPHSYPLDRPTPRPGDPQPQVPRRPATQKTAGRTYEGAPNSQEDRLRLAHYVPAGSCLETQSSR